MPYLSAPGAGFPVRGDISSFRPFVFIKSARTDGPIVIDTFGSVYFDVGYIDEYIGCGS